MILIINICKEKLHELEFVKPIEDILTNNQIKLFTKKYSQITPNDLEKASKIIICGTSLKDNEFLNNLAKFQWIKNFNKPILGICGGMHILHAIYNGKKEKNKEIGLIRINFKKNFLSLIGNKEVYNLHQYYYDSKEFETFENQQISKHKTKPFYGTIFHPEVRNKEIILNFTKN